MKKRIWILSIGFMYLLTAKNLNAQDTLGNKMNFAFGCDFNQIQNNYVAGFDLTSPYFCHQALAVRLQVNASFIRTTLIGNENEGTYVYNTNRLGILRKWSILEKKIDTYMELGASLSFLNKDVSSKDIGLGGYLLWGFEFFPVEGFSFFSELGVMNTNAKADKALQNISYSNGFLIGVGFRYHFADYYNSVRASTSN